MVPRLGSTWYLGSETTSRLSEPPSTRPTICFRRRTSLEPSTPKVSWDTTIREAQHFEKNLKTEEQVKVALLATKRRREEFQGRKCGHCKKPGHNENECWILHPKLRPKRPRPDKSPSQPEGHDANRGNRREDPLIAALATKSEEKH